MRRLKTTRVVLGVLVGLCCASCDPSYQMRPVGWPPAPDGKWAKDVGGFTVRAERISGLIGETWLYLNFEIEGNKLPVKLESARLQAQSGVYEGKLDKRCQVVAAGEQHGRLCVSWAFDQNHTVPKVMGERSVIILTLQVGTDSRPLQVEYERYGD